MHQVLFVPAPMLPELQLLAASAAAPTLVDMRRRRRWKHLVGYELDQPGGAVREQDGRLAGPRSRVPFGRCGHMHERSSERARRLRWPLRPRGLTGSLQRLRVCNLRALAVQNQCDNAAPPLPLRCPSAPPAQAPFEHRSDRQPSIDRRNGRILRCGLISHAQVTSPDSFA